MLFVVNTDPNWVYRPFRVLVVELTIPGKQEGDESVHLLNPTVLFVPSGYFLSSFPTNYEHDLDFVFGYSAEELRGLLMDKDLYNALLHSLDQVRHLDTVGVQINCWSLFKLFRSMHCELAVVWHGMLLIHIQY